MMTLPYGSTSCVRFQGSGTNPLSALTGSPSSDDYSERPLFCKEPFSSFFPLLFDDQQILKRTLRHMVHALRVAPVLHGAVSPTVSTRRTSFWKPSASTSSGSRFSGMPSTSWILRGSKDRKMQQPRSRVYAASWMVCAAMPASMAFSFARVPASPRMAT